MSNNKFIRLQIQREPRDTFYNCYVSVKKGTIDEEDFINHINEVFKEERYPESNIKTYFLERDGKIIANIYMSYINHTKYITLSYGKIRNELIEKLPQYEQDGKIIKPYINIRGITKEDYQKQTEKLDVKIKEN